MSINIRTSDFEEFGFEYIFYNLTSQMEFLDYKKISAYEFYEDGMRFIAPKGICSTGHSGFIAIFSKKDFVPPKRITPGGKIEGSLMVGIGKIKSVVESEHNETFIMDLKFSQYPQDVWKKIADEFIKRQESIDTLVEKINGQ